VHDETVVKINKKIHIFVYSKKPQIYKGLKKIISCYSLYVVNKMFFPKSKIQNASRKAATPVERWPPPLVSPPAAAAAETYRACSAAPLADHFTRTLAPCNSFNVLKNRATERYGSLPWR
jgi:hypothetical protein